MKQDHGCELFLAWWAASTYQRESEIAIVPLHLYATSITSCFRRMASETLHVGDISKFIPTED
jgi:hypothetical protein